VDTRNKIVAPAALPAGAFLTAVTGYFDVLRAAHIRDLASAARPGAKLVVVVLPYPRAVLPQRARAELVAALRMVDYVLTAENADPDRLLEFLKPAAVVRLEARDEQRALQLKEHVRTRQR
jgi:bifunctional ADP-heptose synthase (sugar kinase/adenylyltransferase)